MYCNRSQKTSQRVKNSHATRLRLVSYFFVLYTLWRHLSSITVHTRKNVVYLLNRHHAVTRMRMCFLYPNLPAPRLEFFHSCFLFQYLHDEGFTHRDLKVRIDQVIFYSCQRDSCQNVNNQLIWKIFFHFSSLASYIQ